MPYRAITLLNNGQTIGSSTAIGSIPASCQVDDIVLIAVVEGTGNSTYTVSTSGATAPANLHGPDYLLTNLAGQVWWMRLTAADLNAVITITASIGARFIGVIGAFSGEDASATPPILYATSSSTAAPTGPAVTTTAVNSDVAYIWLNRVQAATQVTLTAPATHTLAGQSITNFSALPNYGVALTYVTTPGAIQTYAAPAATLNQTASGVECYAIALAPDPGFYVYGVNANGTTTRYGCSYVASNGTLSQVTSKTA